MKKSTIAYLSLAVILCGLFLWFLFRYQDSARETRFSEAPKNAQILGVVPDFELTDQNGKPFSKQSLQGKVWVADFIFTRCAGPCPLMTQQMRMLQNKLEGEAEVYFVSLSVDPEYDRPEILKKYAEKYEVNLGNWSFLTGDKEEIFKLAVQHFYLGVGEVPPEEVEEKDQNIWHSTKFVLVDPNSNIRGYYDSQDINEINELEQDIRRLLE